MTGFLILDVSGTLNLLSEAVQSDLSWIELSRSNFQLQQTLRTYACVLLNGGQESSSRIPHAMSGPSQILAFNS